jgi:hypothetical protein
MFVATINEQTQENVINLELRQWIIPALSTTRVLAVKGDKSGWEYISNRIEEALRIRL